MVRKKTLFILAIIAAVGNAILGSIYFYGATTEISVSLLVPLMGLYLLHGTIFKKEIAYHSMTINFAQDTPAITFWRAALFYLGWLFLFSPAILVAQSAYT